MSVTFTETLSVLDREILNPQAIELVTKIEQKFGKKRRDLMQKRQRLQERLDAGDTLDFLPETSEIRNSEWNAAKAYPDIEDRRVEITGPCNRRMMINALNCGAKVFMADLEDAYTPSWPQLMAGQINLRDAFSNQLTFDTEDGRHYKVNENPAVLMVRVRGLHMEERHVLLDNKPISAGFFDFALFLANNYQAAKDNNKGLYLYIPKLEHYLEARLWNEVFAFTEEFLGIKLGTLRCTVLIETITASFQMEEILYELRNYIVGLNAGRWDYIFNFIKRFKNHPDKVLPERSQVTMGTHFLRSYSRLLINTCHKRGAHAMGGMAAQIPVKNDDRANEIVKEKIEQDKLREVTDGHDGTWVAHPALVPIAMDVFDQYMPEKNQLNRYDPEFKVSKQDLLTIPNGTITPEGIKINISVSLRYLMAWLGGNGAVPIFNLMEDAATAEISRAQLWQWCRTPNLKSSDGKAITFERVKSLISAEVKALELDATNVENLHNAANIFSDLIINDHFEEFLTTPAYQFI